MSEECKCFCRSDWFKKFTAVTLGSFIGVYCALCVFAALHKPPMMYPHHFNKPPMGYHHMHKAPHFNGPMMPERPMKPVAPIKK